MASHVLQSHVSRAHAKRRIETLFMLLPVALLGASCATQSGNQEKASLPAMGAVFKSQEYHLCSADAPQKVLLNLHITEYRVNGEELIVVQESRVARELRGAITNFFNAILANPTVRKDIQAQPAAVRARVAINAAEDTHTAGTALKAGLSGFFTFGLAGNPAGKYDYDCRMVVSLTRADGQSRDYQAREKVSAEDRLEAGEPASIARREAATASFNAIVAQLSQDRFLSSSEN